MRATNRSLQAGAAGNCGQSAAEDEGRIHQEQGLELPKADCLFDLLLFQKIVLVSKIDPTHVFPKTVLFFVFSFPPPKSIFVSCLARVPARSGAQPHVHIIS